MQHGMRPRHTPPNSRYAHTHFLTIDFHNPTCSNIKAKLPTSPTTVAPITSLAFAPPLFVVATAPAVPVLLAPLVDFAITDAVPVPPTDEPVPAVAAAVVCTAVPPVAVGKSVIVAQAARPMAMSDVQAICFKEKMRQRREIERGCNKTDRCNSNKAPHTRKRILLLRIRRRRRMCSRLCRLRLRG